jgi:squalene-associated FAD-dependent desaturase
LGGRATSYDLQGDEHIDNCQHVTLRCCTNLEDFYFRIGVLSKITYNETLFFADSTGRRAEMRPAALPAPFHLSASFAKFSLLNWRDKLGIGKAMMRILLSGGHPRLQKPLSMMDWLHQQKQTPRAIDRFWRTVLVSALNEELSQMDARYGIDVFWKAFLSNRKGFAMGVPSVPLADLYASSGERICQNGGQVRLRCGVAEIRLRETSVSGIRLDDGTVVDADYYVAAVTIDRLMKLLSEDLQHDPLFSNLEHLRMSPITGVHLWFSESVMSEPFLTSVDQTIQWIFNKRSGEYLQIVISASRSLSDLSQQSIVELCLRELGELLPAVRKATLVRSVVIRENTATFSPEPDSDRWRPQAATPLANLLLAGDWTQTGWPATMEGAVRSGYRAAEAILQLEGRSASLLKPDLPPSGVARWFAR